MRTKRWKRICLTLLLAFPFQIGITAALSSHSATFFFDETDSVSSGSSYCNDVGTVNIAQWPRKSTLELGVSAGNVLVVDRYQRQWLHETKMSSLQVGWRHRTTPDETDDFAAEYGYPEWAIHLMWGNYSGVRMQKYPSPDWGLLVPVDYPSNMGHLIALYSSFSRPIRRNSRWNWGYSLETGVAYNTRPYARRDNIDNELTGSHFLFYFGAGLYGTVRLNNHWSARLDLAFRHVSNGATDRPNKGANSFAPNLTLQYDLDETAGFSTKNAYQAPTFSPHNYYSAALSLGGRTLLEEWVNTQYSTDPSAPDYRRETFDFHPTYNLQLDAMRRHSRRWATGIGADLFYMPYIDKLRRHDAIHHPEVRHHHRLSAGLALKHEAFYGRVSMYVHLGVYLFRRTGYFQKLDETPYYERIGVRYRLPFDGDRWSAAIGIKAHSTKADFSEITISRRF